MNLYAVSWYDTSADEGERDQVEWVGTQADRDRRYNSLRKQVDVVDLKKQDVNVPTDKAGLMAWLNERGVQP